MKRHPLLTSSLATGFGVMIGGALVPRLFFPGNFNDTWPPLFLHCAGVFLVGFLSAFAVRRLGEVLFSPRAKEKQQNHVKY